MREPFLRKLKIRNYKSIKECNVALGALTLLVGRNGSGKSNFLDALRFVSDGLQTSLDHAIRSRGGIDEVRRRSQGHPNNFSIGIDFGLPDQKTALYEFEIGAREKGGFFVKNEVLQIVRANGQTDALFEVDQGSPKTSVTDNPPPASTDRLYLVNAAGFPQFKPAYDALLAMGFYNLNPQQMKEVQSQDAGELLRRDGSNIASVVARLTSDEPEKKKRINEYLQAIVSDIVGFERIAIGHRETLEFRQNVLGSAKPWRFYAASMSDGTLRALGVLVATMQLADRKSPIRLVGIEEPETALHPAATGALIDALREAAATTQVLVTTHSPDLLDKYDSTAETLLVVQSDKGTTFIAPADPASREAIGLHLCEPGDLLRQDQLQPDRNSLRQQDLAFVSNEDSK